MQQSANSLARPEVQALPEDERSHKYWRGASTGAAVKKLPQYYSLSTTSMVPVNFLIQ